MKKITSVTLAVAFLLSACTISIPGLSTPTAVIQPTNSPPLTETQTPPPTPTPVLASPSETPASASFTPENTATVSPVPNLTTTLVTATGLLSNPSATS